MRSFSEQVNDFRRRLISSEITRCNGNMSAAARALGMHRNTITYWIIELGMTVDSRRHWGGRRPGCGRRSMTGEIGETHVD